MASVELKGLSKRFGEVTAVSALDLNVREGEFLCVLGPSGCGKTTLLRLIAGLETPDGGTIRFGEELVWGEGRNVPSERRNVGVVFQSYALWPHMSVAENAAYPLRVAGLSKVERESRVARALAAVDLESLAGRRPHELSGGQQQRVALARCLTQEPRIVLMDEPLANLDMHLRENMLEEFRRFHRHSGATIIYITHDQSEAMSMAHRIAIMFNGKLVQIATPEELYQKPADPRVAGFVGLSTHLKAVMDGQGKARVNGPQSLVRASLARDFAPGDRVLLSVRPEDVQLGEGSFRGRVSRAVYLGGRYLVELESDLTETPIKAYADTTTSPGDTVSFRIRRSWAMPVHAEN